MKKYILILLVSLCYVSAYSQDEGPPEEEVIPIDGGIGLLIAAGTAWGIKKIKRQE